MSAERPRLRVDRRGPVAEVVLDRADKRNAMDLAFWTECPKVFDALSDQDDVRCIVVRGEGKGFSAGLDLLSFGPMLQGFFGGTARKRTELLRFIEGCQAAFDAVERCRQPVIAAVHGACVGGGLDMVAACCIRLAAADARFSLREAKLAIVADVGSLQRLPRVIGASNVRELAYTAKDIDAARAMQMGLVSEVLPDEATLLERARALADEIAANPPLVVQGIKRVLRFGEASGADLALQHVAVWNAAFMESDDLTEAVSAFVERRAPTFHGR